MTATSSGSMTYQWYRGSSGTTTSPISGATSSSYTPPTNSRGTFTYWARVTSGSCTTNSATATVVALASAGIVADIQSMTMNLRFAFVCQKKWEELAGEDPVTRFCGTCERTVTNLDPLSPELREVIFREAMRNGTKPCVFATITVEGGAACRAADSTEQDDSEEFVMLGGEPLLDESDEPSGDEIRLDELP